MEYYSLKKVGNSDTGYNTEDIVLSEMSQPQKNKYCVILFT